MSENKSKKNASTATLVATIIVAVAAIALAIVAVITLNKSSGSTSNTPSSSVDTNFKPTDELVEECQYAAHDLVKNNYEIVRLFVTEGLPHYDEPYGNLPEDGVYTVNSTDYTSLSQIEEFVKSVFVNSEAERILTNIDGNGLSVYKNREVFVDVVDEETGETAETTATGETVSRPHYTTETVLGISADFKPDTSYNKDWSSCSIAVLPISENECRLTIYLGGLDESAESADPDNVLETQMVKIDGTWKLSVFVY